MTQADVKSKINAADSAMLALQKLAEQRYGTVALQLHTIFTVCNHRFRDNEEM